MLSLTHGAFASKSLFSHYEGAGVLFPVSGKPGEKTLQSGEELKSLDL